MKRHAVVVGGSSGIGAAIVTELSRTGWSVSALGRRHGEAPADRWVTCDVTAPASVDAAIARCLDEGGTPSAVVYAAGAPAMGRTLDVPEEARREAFEVNFWGLERIVRGFYPAMARAGEGTIVAVSSIAALRAVPFESYYAASKAAAARWLGCFAPEAALAGLRVRIVAPGYIPTGFLERGGWYGMSVPVGSGSGVTADDVARTVCAIVEGRRARTVLGWRETAITLADRLAPGAYDRLLERRMRTKR
jgi:NAD(P)-dependent dehydrogenase (short-subunit alcohol dehydrogenase family)